MKPNPSPEPQQTEQLRILYRLSPELLKIVGKHSTLWNYSKLETIEKIQDLLHKQREEYLGVTEKIRKEYPIKSADYFKELLDTFVRECVGEMEWEDPDIIGSSQESGDQVERPWRRNQLRQEILQRAGVKV